MRTGPRRASGLALGVLAGIGGFVDFGGVITSTQSGARFHTALLWTLLPGIIGFAVFAEMSGRITISTGRTTFDVIRDRLGGHLALVPLVATGLVNILTLAVEIAGMALAVRIGLKLPVPLLAALFAIAVLVVLWRAGFDLLDNTAAILGLTMLVTVAAMIELAPRYSHVAVALAHPDARTTHPAALYAFTVVSLLGAYMTPYQFEFYSSGAMEQAWTGDDLVTNRMSALVGTSCGGLITLALMVTAAVTLFPGHDVKTLLDAARPTRDSFGTAGVAIFAFGTFAVSAGAALETALAGSYGVCQFFGWDWGKRQRPREVPMFHLAILLECVVAVAVVATGVDPIRLTVVTMALAAFALPFTFGPLLIVANDPEYVGDQTNTRAGNAVALVVFAMLAVVTIVTIPLLVITRGGS